MKISNNGKKLIKSFESLELIAYPDPGTGGAPWTIGWGHTGPEVKSGLVWTPAQADAAFDSDIAQFERDVASLVKVPLNQNQFDALVSFAYNCGSSNFASSTLLKKLNAGDYDAAADEFPRWDKAAGKVMNGLTRRRNAERTLFITPCR